MYVTKFIYVGYASCVTLLVKMRDTLGTYIYMYMHIRYHHATLHEISDNLCTAVYTLTRDAYDITHL
jgi:hypothetical protein